VHLHSGAVVHYPAIASQIGPVASQWESWRLRWVRRLL